MQLRLLISISLFAIVLNRAEAQVRPADDFFHSGARSYLTNNTEAARKEVDTGLKFYPDDIKLKKLDELLKQQQQQNQSQQNQSQSKQDQQKQSDEQKQKDQDKQKDQQKQQEQKQQNQQPQQDKDKDKDKDADKDQEKGQPVPAGQMTPEEAKKLLDSQKGDEALLPATQQDKSHDRHLKDW
jgi:outer membrane biosynthesis protein TonB